MGNVNQTNFKRLRLPLEDRGGGDSHLYLPLKGLDVLGSDGQGNPRTIAGLGAHTFFERLPAAAVAATSDPLVIIAGATTPQIARADKGGVSLKTKTTPASGNDVIAKPDSNTGLEVKLSSDRQIVATMQVMFPNIAGFFASFGLNENLTDVQPSGTAGEGAHFLFDPGETITTGLTTAEHANWILAHKVNGVDTWTATSVPVIADKEYELKIFINKDLKAEYYINGTLVGTGPALTSGDTVFTFAGLEITGAAIKEFELRDMGLNRVVA